MAAEGMPILLQKDNTFTKLFVGGLPYHTTNETLKAFFLQYGDIEEAVVIHDRVSSKSKGYGFVTMADKDGAERACATPNPNIDGRKANVNLAYLGAKPKNYSQPGSPIQAAGLPRSDSPSGALFTQQSPPPLPMGFQAHGFFMPPVPPGFYDNPQAFFDSPPFSPPPVLPPFMYPPYFNPPYSAATGMNFVPPPVNIPTPQQQMPPLVPYNAAN